MIRALRLSDLGGFLRQVDAVGFVWVAAFRSFGWKNLPSVLVA